MLLKNTVALAAKLGPILFQLPPNLKKDVERLKNFIGYLPSDRRYAFEFRDESWWDEDTFAAMRDRDIAMCISESAEPSVLLSVPLLGDTSGFTNWTTISPHLSNGRSVWLRRTGTDAYVYFKHDEGEGSGPPAVEAFVREGAASTTV